GGGPGDGARTGRGARDPDRARRRPRRGGTALLPLRRPADAPVPAHDRRVRGDDRHVLRRTAGAAQCAAHRAPGAGRARPGRSRGAVGGRRALRALLARGAAAEHPGPRTQPRGRRCGRDRRRPAIPARYAGRRARGVHARTALRHRLNHTGPAFAADTGERLCCPPPSWRCRGDHPHSPPSMNQEAVPPAVVDPFASQPHAIVERDGVRYTLLGTAHVSRDSLDAVRAAIDTGAFDAISVELDLQRMQALSDPDALAKLDLVKVIREGKAALFAANLGLAAYQRR